MEVEKMKPSGTAVAGLTTGIIGSALGILGTNGIGTGILGNNNYVNRETYDVQMKLIEAERNNAILAADLSSEKKMVEVFNGAIERTNAVRDELNSRIRDLEKQVDANASAQAVINCGFNSGINLLNNQVAQLFGMTKLIIPNASVMPGWGTNATG